MEYNSNREDLVILEYGRHIQKMVDYAKTIEDPALRQAFTERVVDLMQQMNPQNRTGEDFREKLWKHLFRIAKYELDVTPPEGISPSPEDAKKRPEAIPYPKSTARKRHYGENVQQLINKALSMPEGPKRDAFALVIANYMKLAYKTWNRDYYVSDDVIKEDIRSMSNDGLVIDEEKSLENLGGSQNNSSRRRNSGGSGRGKYGSRGRSRNNNRRSKK